jgi:hypothetical protein
LVGTNHVWGNNGNDGVPEPVRGGGETDTTGADGEREDLADKNPGTRAPGGSEEEDEDGDKCNLGVDSSDVVGNWVTSSVVVSVVEADGNTNDANEELADQHTEGTPDEKWATSEFLNGVERERSGANVDESEDQGDQEGVADGTGRLQEGGGVVEDEVHTSPTNRLAMISPTNTISTYHCCIICREVPKIVRRMLDFCSQREPLKQFIQEDTKPVLGITLRSYSSLAMISASSFWMYSDSVG